MNRKQVEELWESIDAISYLKNVPQNDWNSELRFILVQKALGYKFIKNIKEERNEITKRKLQIIIDDDTIIREHIGGCGDGGCIIKKPVGLQTNGGCKCSKDYIKMQRLVYQHERVIKQITKVKNEII